jgi:hypothetical protein
MRSLIELFCELDEFGAWLLSKTILAAWQWLFPKKVVPKDATNQPAVSASRK